VLSDDTAAALDRAVDAFKLEFQTGEGKPLVGPGKEQFESMPAEDINQEKIVKTRR
jgi:F-type H+-transporting ATPase subunit alpha